MTQSRTVSGESAKKVDRVLADVAFLVECRLDVDRGIRDDKRLTIGRDVEREDMADAPLRLETGPGGEDGA